jgi:aryl-alcohol dehydrogenase-like predicted oxidoreductase
MRALDDVVRAGKALYVGISDTPAWIVSRANTLADLRGWSRFVGLQIEYSLIQRTPERDLLPMARALDIAVTPWAVLGFGVLTGKYLEEGPGDTRLATGDWRLQWVTERNNAIAREVVAVAEEIGRTPSQVAINWVRGRQEKARIVPIVGARTAAQLEENLGCLEFHLEPEHLTRLNEASRIDLGFPHDFLARDGIRKLILGDAADRIVDHRR